MGQGVTFSEQWYAMTNAQKAEVIRVVSGTVCDSDDLAIHVSDIGAEVLDAAIQPDGRQVVGDALDRIAARVDALGGHQGSSDTQALDISV